VRDQPGQLAKVCNILTEMRANIKDIEHERAFLLADVGMTKPIITIETQGFTHVNEILAKIEKAGFPKPYLATPSN
jgi:threonine dehydratase